MWWVVAIAWGVALVVATVIMGFCLYELRWKSVRLRRDLSALQVTAGKLAALQAQLGAVSDRLTAARSGR